MMAQKFGINDMPSYKRGGLVKKTGPAMVHKGEWISGAIRHPGALTAAAKKAGRSKRQEAEAESHSSNKHIRSRGILGLRFMKGGDIHK